MKFIIGISDYRAILKMAVEDRVTLEADDLGVLHPEVIPRSKARKVAGKVYFTQSQCLENLEAFHELEILSDFEAVTFMPEAMDSESADSEWVM